MTHSILLAADSVTLRKAVELTFSDEDFVIDSVGDGAQAFEHARAERPDIIVSDVMMPGLNGYELCQQIKSDPALRSVPFLFLKGTFESFDEEQAHSCGADGFIVKPFESQELIARVRELIEGADLAPLKAQQHPRWETPSAPPVHPAVGQAPQPAAVPTRPATVPVTPAAPIASPAPAPPFQVPPMPPRPMSMPLTAAPVSSPAYAPPAVPLRQPPVPQAPSFPEVRPGPTPPTMPARPAPLPPAPLRPAPPIPPRPVRPVAAPAIPAPPPLPAIPRVPIPPLAPEELAPPPPPVRIPPPPAHAPTEDFGFDFAETEAERPVAAAPQLSLQRTAAPILEPQGEAEEDLWSEVSLRDHSKDHLEVRPTAQTGDWAGAGILELQEETVAAADEVVFEEVSAAPVAPPAPQPEAPPAAASPRVEPAPEPPPVPAPSVLPAFDQAELERLVAARMEAVVRQVLEPVVKDLARAMIEEVAWDVIPGLAEAMIESEIERIRKSACTD